MTITFFRPEAGEAGVTLAYADARELFGERVRIDASDDDLAALGLHRIHQPAEMPQPGRYEMLREHAPELIDGRYVRRVEVVPMFADVLGPDGAVLLSAQAQRDRYDANLLCIAASAARERVAQAWAAAMAEGLKIEGVGHVGLSPEDARLLDDAYLAWVGCTHARVFDSAGRAHRVTRAKVLGMLTATARRRLDLAERRAGLLEAIDRATSDEQVAAIRIEFPKGVA